MEPGSTSTPVPVTSSTWPDSQRHDPIEGGLVGAGGRQRQRGQQRCRSAPGRRSLSGTKPAAVDLGGQPAGAVAGRGGGIVGGWAPLRRGPAATSPEQATASTSASTPSSAATRRMAGRVFTFGFLSAGRCPGTSREVMASGSAPFSTTVHREPPGQGHSDSSDPRARTWARPTAAGQCRTSTGFPRWHGTRCAHIVDWGSVAASYQRPCTATAPGRRPPVSKPLPYEMPTFDNVDEERQHLKQRLAAAFRLFGKFGFSEGVAGHITARDPELPDHFWVNPFAIDFGLIKVSDLILRQRRRRGGRGRLPGEHGRLRHPLPGARGPARREGRGPRPLGPRQGLLVARSAARPAHPGRLRVLRRPRALRRLHRRRARRRGGQAHRPRPRREQGRHPAQPRPAHRRATRVDEAAWWFITMERSCQAQLLAKAAGTPGPDRPRDGRR